MSLCHQRPLYRRVGRDKCVGQSQACVPERNVFAAKTGVCAADPEPGRGLMDQGRMTDGDAAMAKISATEMLQFVADEAIQVLGGMGLMDELPIERIWRDARVDRIWDGTSEIQRHIVSRQLLRPLGA